VNTTTLKERKVAEVEQFLQYCTLEMVALLMVLFLKKLKVTKKKPWSKEVQNITTRKCVLVHFGFH
jgi:hypothetical protein